MLAKVCSDKNKPNGQYRIPPEKQVVMEFMKDLPVRKVRLTPFIPGCFIAHCRGLILLFIYLFQVSGIGKVTEKMLAALGIVSCAQLGQQMALLSLLFSETSWHHFLHISLGLGSTYIERCEVLMYTLKHQTYLSNINKLHGQLFCWIWNKIHGLSGLLFQRLGKKKHEH